MIGALIIINDEERIITAFTSTTVVTVGVAFSQNYSGVVAGSWGVYSKSQEIKSNGDTVFYTITGTIICTLYGASNILSIANILSSAGYKFYSTSANYSNSFTHIFSSTSNPDSTKDVGIRRNTAGILEIYNGINANGLEANRRDLYLRKLLASTMQLIALPDSTGDAIYTKQLTAKPDGTVGWENKYGVPTLQQVTAVGATTNVPTIFEATNGRPITAISNSLTVSIFANNYGGGTGILANGSTGIDSVGRLIGIRATSNNGKAGVFNITYSNTSNIVEFQKEDVNQASISHDGKVTANSFIKSGGTSSQFLKADGSVDTNSYLQSTTGLNHSELTLNDGTNPHGTTKTNVGLANVDNTSDLNKPISTATQTALNGKQEKFETTFISVESALQSIPILTFTNVIMSIENSDAGNNFANNLYTVPSDGIYQITGTIRASDNLPAGSQFGVGVAASSGDGAHFLWHTIQSTTDGANRTTFPYIRVSRYTAGQQLRMFTFTDAASFSIKYASMQIIKIGN